MSKIKKNNDLELLAFITQNAGIALCVEKMDKIPIEDFEDGVPSIRIFSYHYNSMAIFVLRW